MASFEIATGVMVSLWGVISGFLGVQGRDLAVAARPAFCGYLARWNAAGIAVVGWLSLVTIVLSEKGGPLGRASFALWVFPSMFMVLDQNLLWSAASNAEALKELVAGDMTAACIGALHWGM